MDNHRNVGHGADLASYVPVHRPYLRSTRKCLRCLSKRLVSPCLQYAFFFSFPVVFGEGYHWNDGLVGLTFLSVIIGVCCALFATTQVEKDYARRAAAKGGHADPEDRLVGMMIGCWSVPICKSFRSSFMDMCSDWDA